MINNVTPVLLLSLSFLAGLPDCFSQPSPKPRKYTTIITSTVRTKTKGNLLDVSDSSILVYSGKMQMRIPASTINRIKIKRTAAAGRGALTGGLVGFVAGAVGGFVSGDDDPCPQGSWFCDPLTAEEKALGFGLVFSLGGALIGTVIGSVSKVELITVNGDQNVFLNNADKLRKYTVPSSERH